MEKVEKNKKSFSNRLKSMLRVDFYRMLRSRLFYIIIACALLVPIIMTVMLTMMDGQESVNQQTGEITILEGPDYVWESIGSLPSDKQADGEEAAMGNMDVMALCNINMAFMGVAIFVCLFISDDFRSGYSKNLFTVRSKRTEYVISKTLMGFICGALMLLAYFVGAMLGGAISGLSFELTGGLTLMNIVMCMIAKILLMLVFVSIFVIISIGARSKAWLSICGSLGGGMLLFMMVSMITPLGSTIANVGLCLAGGLIFAVGLGAISRVVLRKANMI